MTRQYCQSPADAGVRSHRAKQWSSSGQVCQRTLNLYLLCGTGIRRPGAGPSAGGPGTSGTGPGWALAHGPE